MKYNSNGREKSFSGRVERLYLVEHVSNELRSMIFDGHFEPDNILPAESDIAEMFSVSRTVVRESMRNLRSQGIVEVSQGKLPRVKVPDAQAAIETLSALMKMRKGSLNDLLEVRYAVDGEIAFLAAKRATEKDILKIEQIVHDMEHAKNLNDAIEFDMRFHRTLADATGNPIFVVLIETLKGLLIESQYASYAEHGLHDVAGPHRRIIEAVKNKDGNAAKEAMIDHLVFGITRDYRN
jgi:GntR family transcriptional repressor for pyruvate dehydrogenase complex